MSALRELRDEVNRRILTAVDALNELHLQGPEIFGPIQARTIIGVAGYAVAVDGSLLAILDALIEKEKDDG